MSKDRPAHSPTGESCLGYVEGVRDEENRQEIAELLQEFRTTREQLRVAKAEYIKRFHELTARLLLQTRTWRSLRIHKRRLAIEISSLLRHQQSPSESFWRDRDVSHALSEWPRLAGCCGTRTLAEWVPQLLLKRRVSYEELVD